MRNRMSEMMTTTMMTSCPYEFTESDSSNKDSITTTNSRSSDFRDGSDGSSPKRPRLDPGVDEINFKNLKSPPDEEYVKAFLSMLDISDSEDEYHGPPGPPATERFPKLVLAYYNETTNKDYQLSRIRSMGPFPPRQDSIQGGTHLNFYARPKGSESGPEYLFYGELQHRPKYGQVVECYRFPPGTDAGIDLILHPPHIICPDCDDIGRYELYDDDDEYFG
ncbi:hypothetical protein RND81_02G229300 [Saponaria officinalis]|uniref:DUF3615 domain-containing protein n=2 Tax=Saponaria officinalis TaxID=3572 RepID=A0AAW1MTG6_SAPOF